MSTRKPATKRGNRWYDLVVAELSNLDVFTYVMDAYGPSWLTEQMLTYRWADTKTAAYLIADAADAY